MWHDDAWVKNNIKAAEEFDYNNIDLLEEYKGTHPAVFKERVTNANWNFNYQPSLVKTNLKYKLLFFIEKLTGWRIGENKNYKLLD